MNNRTLSIRALYQKTFGYVAQGYLENSDAFAAYQKTFSYIGKPYLDANPLAYIPGTGIIKNGLFSSKSVIGTTLFMPCKLDDFQLPNEPTIKISGSKKIVKTEIDGQDGEFKELYSMNDWQIVIRGICTNDETNLKSIKEGKSADDYPEEQVRAIRKILEKRSHVKIDCFLTTLFDIRYVAIESFDFPDVEGAPGMQPYEIVCSSDKYYALDLTEEENQQ